MQRNTQESRLGTAAGRLIERGNLERFRAS
jgi:hypothetical protein